MAVMDEFREERETLKNASTKTKLEYFWDYYKWHVIVGAVAIICIISLVTSIVNNKDFAFHGYFLNTYAEEENTSPFINDFAERAGIDQDDYEIRIDTSLYLTAGSVDENSRAAMERIMVTIAANQVDFLAADEAVFLQYANADNFYDLSQVLTDEQLEKYADYLYYIDMAAVRAQEEAYNNDDFAYTIEPYDHYKPEAMEEPVPIGLVIQDCPKLKDRFFFQEGDIPMGIINNTEHLDTTLQFIDYLFEDLVEE